MKPKEDKPKPTQPPTGLPAAPDPNCKPDPNAPPDPTKRVHHEKRDPSKDPSKTKEP